MNIGFYSPYLDTLGGGERYVLTLASYWSKKHVVSVFWDHSNIAKRAEARFNIDLSRVKFVQNIFRKHNILKKLYISRTYDLLFILSDGSVPLTAAHDNILHFQVPFGSVRAGAYKLSQYRAIVCNSQFTARHIDARLRRRTTVIYPPVEMVPGKAHKKKMILSVGRFSSHHQAKKQEVLIRAFMHAQDLQVLSGWKLILAGGLHASDTLYFEALKNSARGQSIELYPNVTRDKLLQLYRDCSIYWHSAGYLETDPERMEHFGISTVEAMSAGCIPVVYQAGGQLEIVEEGVSGYFWKTEEELIKKTINIIDNTRARDTLQNNARIKSRQYEVSVFTDAFDKLRSETLKI